MQQLKLNLITALSARHVCAMCLASTDNCQHKCCNRCKERCSGMQACRLSGSKAPYRDQLERWDTWYRLVQTLGYAELAPIILNANLGKR